MIIKPIGSQEEYTKLVEQAGKDGHTLIAPSHAIVSGGGELRGSLTILPMMLVWVDTKLNTARDTQMIEGIMTSLAACQGQKVFCVPCTEKSPYFPLMEKMGYTNVGSMNLFLKGVV